MLKDGIISLMAKFGEQTVQTLKDYHEQAGQKASGETLKQFVFKVSDDGRSITLFVEGADHIEYLDRGRGTGGLTPIASLTQWIKDKGLGAGLSDKQTVSFAWAIAKTHANKGSYQNRSGKTYKGFIKPVSSAFTQAKISKFIDKLNVSLVDKIDNDIMEMFKNSKIA